jgi:D-arabinose 1-dehydrogenase-like Zn-dependent alcohol dehydrogenase
VPKADIRIAAKKHRYSITVWRGGHARYMKVPVSTLVALPDSLSFVTGAAISCGAGTAWGALRRLQLQGGETIAIFGQGPVGLSATQLAVEMGARASSPSTSHPSDASLPGSSAPPR